MNKKNNVNPYFEGKRADPTAKSPYPVGSRDDDLWIEGFLTARSDESEKRFRESQEKK